MGLSPDCGCWPRRAILTGLVKGVMTEFRLIDAKFSDDYAAEKTALVVLSAGGLAAPAMVRLLGSLGCDEPTSGQNSTNKIAEFNDAALLSSGTTANHWSPFNNRWLA